MSRDVRLDLMRGYAMLAIAVNHVALVFAALGFAALGLPTLTALGYSSAAALFFGLSGYMVGLVYLRQPEMSRSLWRRIGVIYAVNTVVFVIGLLFAFTQSESIQVALGYAPIVANPALGSALFFALLRQPALLDVLHMYVLLLASTPLLAFAMKLHPSGAIVASLVIYVATQLLPWFAPPAATLDTSGTWALDGRWNMNVFSWQLLFFGSMYAGTRSAHHQVFAWVEKSAARRWTIIGLFSLVALVKIGDKLGYWGTPDLVGKRTLEPLRLAHFGLTVLLLASLMVQLRHHLDHPIAQLVALVGRQSLYCFAASILATYLAASVWSDFGSTYSGYLLACLFVIASIVCVAWGFDRRKRSQPV